MVVIHFYDLVNKAKLLHSFSYYVHFFSLHVSGDYVSGMQEHILLHTRQSSTRNDKYQVSQKHNCFSLWWAHSRPKHVQKRNEHNKKNCATIWLYFQDAARTCGQQNKNFVLMVFEAKVISSFPRIFKNIRHLLSYSSVHKIICSDFTARYLWPNTILRH